jgi:hypothetical protein
MSGPDLHRTRFDVIRESELDMRCMVRDMKNRRATKADLNALRLRKRRGYRVDEIQEVRLVAREKRLSALILGRWDRLHRRMNRESTRKAEVENFFSERRAGNGDSAHP